MIEVVAPDGTIIEFPDGTDEATILDVMRKNFGGPQPSPTRQTATPEETAQARARAEAMNAQSMEAMGVRPNTVAGAMGDAIGALGAGLARGGAELVGLPGTLVDVSAWGADKVSRALGGPPVDATGSPFSGAAIRGVMSDATGGATEYRGQTPVSKVGGTIGEFLPGAAALSGGNIAKSAINYGVAAGTASELAGQATEGTALEPWARIVGGLVGGGLAGMVGAAKEARAIRDAMKATPAVQALKDQASKLYDAARQNGAAAVPQQNAQLRSDMVKFLRSEGVITPSGVMSDYPKLKHAIQLVGEYAKTKMNPTQMLAIRKSFGKAANSLDPQEARLGSILIGQFDNFADKFAPQIKEANAIYRRMHQGRLIEKTIELAEERAKQFSGSGMENALRTEFRALSKLATKGRLKVSPDELRLIREISRGTAGTNAARYIGKLAPTGVVSAAASGGVPFAIGSAMGGPAVGAAAGLGTMLLGAAGRVTGNALQMKKAELLSALARSGGRLPTTSGGGNALGMVPGLMGGGN